MTEKSTNIKNIFRSLQYRNYRLFFGGQSISLIGTWIQRIATPWLVYHLTDSVFLLGLVGFAGQIPTLLLAPFAGVISDRRNRYHILIATQAAAMLQALMLAALYFSGIIQVWHIVVLSVFLGCVNAFDVPARQSFVVQMIEKKENLGNAIALNSSMFNLARLLGPSIAGILIAFANEGVCFLINGISYSFVILSLLMMHVTVKQTKSKKEDVFLEMKEGFSYTFGFAPIRFIILLLGLIGLMGMPYTVLMPVFAREILHGGPHTFGFLMGASGLGALIGAIYLASHKKIQNLTRVIPAASLVFSLCLILFSFSRVFILSEIIIVFAGLGMMLHMASSNTILQTIVDDKMRGRVMSFYTMSLIGVAPLGSLLAGTLAKIIGAPYTMLIGGITCSIGALVFAKKHPKIKELIHPVFVKQGIIPREVSTGIQSASEPVVPPGK